MSACRFFICSGGEENLVQVSSAARRPDPDGLWAYRAMGLWVAAYLRTTKPYPLENFFLKLTIFH